MQINKISDKSFGIKVSNSTMEKYAKYYGINMAHRIEKNLCE